MTAHLFAMSLPLGIALLGGSLCTALTNLTLQSWLQLWTSIALGTIGFFLIAVGLA